MLRDLLSKFSIQAGLVFFLVVVGGSLFYSWHVRRTTEAELERSDAFLQQRPNKNKMPTASDAIDTDTSPVDVTPRKRSMKTDDTQLRPDETEVLPINETERIDLTDAYLPAEDVPVSPFGFGAYPELPEGWQLILFLPLLLKVNCSDALE